MGKKKKSLPLAAAHNSDWIEKAKVSDASAEPLKKYLKRFVCEAECLESSRLTNGFIKDFRIDRTERASSFMAFMRLVDDDSLRFRAFDTPGKLAEALDQDSFGSDLFLESQNEFVYITFSGNAQLKRSLEALQEFKKSSKHKTGRKKQNKSVFYRLDFMLRHLRNAFAHGQFRIVVSPEGETYWALQDANSRGRITSRMFLKQSTLDSWMNLFYRRDIRYQGQKNNRKSKSIGR